jgi:2-oxoglutarate dehydrogenase E2 component (dihydrolipoamide succinyltransferase)
MSLEVKVPSVGESITEVTIASWHKRDGDTVNADDVLCELESDKATFELNAESSGVLRILAQEGETVPIGALICRIEEKNGAQPAATKPAQKAAPTVEPNTPNTNRTSAIPETKNQSMQETTPTTEVVEMKVPAVGESISEVTIANWTKKDGEKVQIDDVLCEIESDKATFELTAEAAGTLRIVAQAGTTLAIGDLICRIEKGAASENGNSSGGITPNKEMYAAPKEVLKEENKKSDEPGTQPAQTTPVADNQSTSSTSYATGHASPAAAKILAEKGIENKQVKGTGIDGRITKADALQAEKTQLKAPAPQENAKPQAVPNLVPAAGNRKQRRQKMTQLRKTVSRRLVAVKNETAMLTTFNEVDMKPIMELRAKYKDKFKEKYNVGLGFMSFFAKAVCVALQEWPAVNAMIDGDEMVYNDFVDISIAVSAPKGLVVPVIRNAEQLSFAQIEAEIIRLAGKARDNKLTIEEMTGGTFTITNGGVFGSMMSTPIINAPQSAILGMHNIIERPVAINGQVEIRPMMYIALSYDHRIIDGRESVSFLVRVKQLLEDPARLLLGI